MGNPSSPSSFLSDLKHASAGLLPATVTCWLTYLAVALTSPQVPLDAVPLPSTQANLSAALCEQPNPYLLDSMVFSLDQ